ncbi:MAG TPA: deoxyribose-phosphate aldolase [Salinivirgaceae bacterium]|nr:deoxyribose-phosphate aldolase [Salinivirgaceae bacterium]
MELLNKYNLVINEIETKESVNRIVKESGKYNDVETLKFLFSIIDLTSLNVSDTRSEIADMTEKVNWFTKTFPNLPNVAAICVYPALVPVVKKTLTTDEVEIASVAAGFPASQTYFDIKTLECKRAVIEGATEVDTVISVGEFFEKNYDYVFREIAAQKSSIDGAYLKLIIESGAMRNMKEIRVASLLAMEAGADFIKTSTGKITPAATPEAAYIMCNCIKEFYKLTGKKIGFKPAGGISTPDDAIVYYAIVKEILGADWLNKKLFRIGASRLANNLLTEISKISTDNDKPILYF